MMKYIYLITTISLMAITHTLAQHYEVRKIPVAGLQITGRGDSPAWQDAAELSAFSYPWREDTPPSTAFRALWDGIYFYFLYRATGPVIVTPQTGEPEKDVLSSSRVEIFFKADDNMDPYYTLELDALGRIFDAECRYYRHVDAAWAWPEGQLIVRASRDEGGYTVEGAISIGSLQQLGMLHANRLQAGLYRAEYLPHTDGPTETRWISWIQPDSAKPDFHIPSSFGLLVLQE
ncbi:MAG: endoxylanase [Lewinellaceae bacterium]|nr:endoxylanase [Lewinellaceae bacterium]